MLKACVFGLTITLIFPLNPIAALAPERQAAIFNSQTVGLYPHQTPSGRLSIGGADNTIINGIGGSALLPDAGVEGTLADIDDQPQSDQISVYVVREGDSLSQIAEMFGVSVNTVRWANDLSTEAVIQEGQTLVILPISGVRHLVRSGDSLASIAKHYNADVKEILQFNGLAAESNLKIGEVVIIPHGEAVVPEAPPTKNLAGGGKKGSSGPEHRGYYVKPVASAVKTQGIHGYNGVDLAAPSGTQIMAAAAGQVMVSKTGGWNGGYGNYIVIRHGNGTQTLYSHNSSNIVSVGQNVVQGQVIGYIGSTGHSTGPHLHFEVRGAKNPF